MTEQVPARRLESNDSSGAVRRRRVALSVIGAALTAVLGLTLAGALRHGSTEEQSASAFVRTCGTDFCVGGRVVRITGANSFALLFHPPCQPAADQETIVRTVSRTGMALIRIPLYQELIEPSGDFSRFDHLIDLARRNHVFILPYLEDENALVADCFVHRPSLPIDWYRTGYRRVDPGHVMSYMRWVTTVLSRYRDEPTIFGWTLMSEPVAAGDACDPAFYRFFAVMSVRAHSADPNHLVNVGSGAPGLPGWSCSDGPNRYDHIDALPGNDFVEFHDYAMPPCTAHLQCVPVGLQMMLSDAGARGKPLLVAEVGIRRQEADRADEMVAKFSEELRAGAAGVLLWDIQMRSRGPGIGDYSIAPQDPLLARLASVAARRHTG